MLYQGHNYALIGQTADVLLMMTYETYEWGYTYHHHSYTSRKPAPRLAERPGGVRLVIGRLAITAETLL